MKNEIEFLSPCPAKGCNGNPRRIVKWSHAKCPGSSELLTNEGNIICKSCGHSFFILDASFACIYHINEYREAGYTELTNAISVLISNPEVDESDLYFLIRVSQKIKERAKQKGII